MTVRTYWIDDDPPTVDQLSDLLGAWLDDLPEVLPVGGMVLPGRCEDVDLGLVEDLVGDIELARGSDSGDVMNCDFYGDEEEHVWIYLSQGGASLVESLTSNPERWMPYDGFGTTAGRMLDGRAVVVATPSDQGLYVLNGDQSGEIGPDGPLVPEIGDLTEHVLEIVEG